MIYSYDDDTIVDECLDSYLHSGIKQGNLDKILDAINEYVEYHESFELMFKTADGDKWVWELPIEKE